LNQGGGRVVVSVFLQAKSESKKCRAKKMVEFHTLPRVGEFVEFRDYSAYAFVVTEVTHSLEGDAPGIRVWLSDTEGKFPEVVGDDDLEAVVETLQEQGWQVLQ
jgi:hypothetical protein